jgi:transposase
MVNKVIPHDWKEARRIRAIELDKQGWPQCQIAEALGVSEAAVSQWLKTARMNGIEMLQARPHPGAPPKLTEAQLHLVPDLLSHGAEAYGFRGDLWTCARMAQVIQWEFEVGYHPAHISRLMKHLNWTPQQPIERALQRDEAAIERWRSETWPALKEKARRERRILVFVDESGFYLLPGVTKTYAPRAQPPILHPGQTRDHLSVMSGITLEGEWYTLVRYHALKGEASVRFLKHLQRYLAKKLLVIWDGSPIHRDKQVKAFLSETGAGRLQIEALPPYAPDLNPVEGVWQHLKHVELRNLCCSNLDHLHDELDLAIMRLRDKPKVIQSFFAGAGLAI